MQNLTHPIIYTAGRLEAIASKYVFSPMGTSIASMKILRLLAEKKAVTSKEVLDLIGGTRSNISQRLDFLEKEKYIVKDYAAFEGDKRKIALVVTAKGKKKLKEIDERSRKAQLALEEFFTSNEKECFRKFMEKLNDILDKKENRLCEFFEK